MTDQADDDTAPSLEGVPWRAAPSRGVTVATPPVSDWAARSVVGSARPANQDQWSQREARRFVVADGMGGRAGGAEAARIACERVLAVDDGAWSARIERINDDLRALVSAPGAGSTLIVLELDAGRATVVSVGDSRVYRVRAGHLEPLTVDHTLRGELLGAGIDADRHASRRETRGLTSFLGIEPERLRVDVVDVPVLTGDRFLLCSDGIHGVVPGSVLQAALEAGSCQDSVEQLFAARDAAVGRDDATAIVVELA